MKDKLGLILGVGIALAALMGLLFFLKNGGRFELIEYIYVLLVLLIVAGTSIILWKRTKDDRPGAFFIGLSIYLNKKGEV
jgi:uncharacterized membrane protein